MAFPASTQRLDSALSSACAHALRVKQFFQQLRNESAAGDVARERIVESLRVLALANTAWTAAASTPGIAAYAQEQLGSPTLDVAAEFTAMLNAASSLRTWIFNNFPKDAGSGAWLVQSHNDSGVPTSLMFTTAQLATFRTNVDTLLATIA